MKIARLLLGSIRLFLFFLSSALIYLYLLITNIFIRDKQRKIKRGIVLRRSIIRFTHFLLGSRIIIYGEEPTVSGLIISNHRTYFDSIVILKNILAYPIAKKELASWPLIGNVCKSTGVLFTDRENKEQRKKLIPKITAILENGYSILNTPEGTTHLEPVTISFKPGAFVIAAQLKKPVIPIAIDYKVKTDAWVGDDTFLPHFIKCFGKWRTEIKVSYLQPVYSSDADELISISKNLIDKELIRFNKEWTTN